MNISKIIIYTAIVIICVWPTQTTAQLTTSTPKREWRAVWLTTLNGLDWPRTKVRDNQSRIKQQQELCKILDQLAAANFNAVVMQVRTRGSVLYKSEIEPWDISLTGRYDVDPGYDPLAFAVEECHKRGMQIHAWIVALPGPKFAQSKQMGKKSMEKRVPNLCVRTSDSYMLNPALDGTAQYLTKMAEEIVSNYDVDGISLDYIRYPEKEIKFNDNKLYKSIAPSGMSLQDWRRSNINHIVETISHRVKELKPWVTMSCSPIGKYDDTQRYSSGGWNARKAVFQDAKLWLEKGWMDVLMPMMYFKGNHFFPFALNWQEGAANKCIAVGLGVYLIDARQKDWDRSVMESEIEFGRIHNLGGQVFFRSSFVTDNPKGIYDLLKDNIYRTKALLPPLSGEYLPPKPSAPQESHIISGANSTTISWKGKEGDMYVVYRSNTYPVDIINASNIYKAYTTDCSLKISSPLNLMQYYAITTIDRYGQESLPLEINKATSAPKSVILPKP